MNFLSTSALSVFLSLTMLLFPQVVFALDGAQNTKTIEFTQSSEPFIILTQSTPASLSSMEFELFKQQKNPL